MTGTLLVNNPEDLYCPMSFIGLINYSKWFFDNKFLIKDDWSRVVGFKNMEELHNLLYKSSIRRTKDLLDLPEKIVISSAVEFSKEEWEVYDDLTRGTNGSKYIDKVIPPVDVLALITRMRQATTACGLISSHTNKSAKLERLKDILDDAKFANQKVLVFCQFKQALEYAVEYCKEYNPKLVVGGLGSRIQEVIDEHENADGFSVLFAQEDVIGVGYTLINTEVEVFLSAPWNRAKFDQCCDRCHRIGQKNTVMIYNLYVKDTYDELVENNIMGKGAMSDNIVDGKELESVMEYIKKLKITYNTK